jgi:hypothetical protein
MPCSRKPLRQIVSGDRVGDSKLLRRVTVEETVKDKVDALRGKAVLVFTLQDMSPAKEASVIQLV